MTSKNHPTKKRDFIKFVTGLIIGAIVVGIGAFFSLLVIEIEKPTAFPILHKKGFTLAYDSRDKIPLWVYEQLSAGEVQGTADRNNYIFKEDPAIYPLHRSTLKDYEKSGFDRGHMAPAADFRNSKEAMEDSFYLSNIAPQNPQLNRKYWLKLERYVRQIAKDNGRVEAITGPLFLPTQIGKKYFVKYEVIGPDFVAVPTHFFKVIRAKKVNEKIIEKAYVIPNTKIEITEPLENFEVSLEKVEKISGLIFQSIWGN